MKQMKMGLARGGFERYGKTTKRAAFLAEMDRVVPWSGLCALIKPYYPKAGRGRQPGGLGAHAAHPFPAALVQPERSGGGGGAVRIHLDARVRGHRLGARACAR